MEIISIVGISVSVLIAVVGWTVVASLSRRLKISTKIELTLVRLETLYQGHESRIMVLESQHNAVLASLTRIEARLEASMARSRE
jgi:hypothetical protein